MAQDGIYRTGLVSVGVLIGFSKTQNLSILVCPFVRPTQENNAFAGHDLHYRSPNIHIPQALSSTF